MPAPVTSTAAELLGLEKTTGAIEAGLDADLVAANTAELVLSDVLWPDFREAELFAAIADYQRKRGTQQDAAE